MNGKRESVALKLIPLSGESTYALTRQWPSEGKWVITLVQANPRFNGQPSAIVKVDGDAVDWADVMRLPQPPTTQEIDAALHSTAVASRL